MGYGSRARGPSFARIFGGASIGVAVAAIAMVLNAPPRGAATTSSSLSGTTQGGTPLQATILRDEHGIPNIIGDNFADIGFGYGYSLAEDNICEIAESYVTVRGERSQYTGDGVQGTFGPDGSYEQKGNGFTAENLNSDFFYQRLIDNGTVEHLLDQPPPEGPVDQIREGVA